MSLFGSKSVIIAFDKELLNNILEITMLPITDARQALTMIGSAGVLKVTDICNLCFKSTCALLKTLIPGRCGGKCAQKGKYRQPEGRGQWKKAGA